MKNFVRAMPVVLLAQLIWFTPYFPGKTRVLQAISKKIPLYLGDLKHHTGFIWSIDSGHAQSMYLFSCEPFSSRVLLNFAPHVDMFLDIGANRGWYSCLLKTANPNLEIHAFEPDEKIHNILRNNLMQYSPVNENIHVNKMATGRRNGFATLSTYLGGNDGMMTLYPQDEMSIKSNQTVKIQAIDSYFPLKAKSRKEKLTLIKIDVEGSELETIEGAKEFISLNRPLVLMEINSLLLLTSKTTSKSVFDLMKSLGYIALWVDERGRMEICKSHDYPPHQRILGVSTGANYLFLHQQEMKKPFILNFLSRYRVEVL